MPTYSYTCTKCQHQCEVLQKMTDEPLKTCPQCLTENSLQRGIGGGVGLRFKGEGFYVNDYASKSAKNIESKKQKDNS